MLPHDSAKLEQIQPASALLTVRSKLDLSPQRYDGTEKEKCLKFLLHLRTSCGGQDYVADEEVEQRCSRKLGGCGNFPDCIISETCVFQLASKLRLADLATAASLLDEVICAGYAVSGPTYLLQYNPKQTDMPGKLLLREEDMHGIEVMCQRWDFAANSIVRPRSVTSFLTCASSENRGQTHVEATKQKSILHHLYSIGSSGTQESTESTLYMKEK